MNYVVNSSLGRKIINIFGRLKLWLYFAEGHVFFIALKKNYVNVGMGALYLSMHVYLCVCILNS